MRLSLRQEGKIVKTGWLMSPSSCTNKTGAWTERQKTQMKAVNMAERGMMASPIELEMRSSTAPTCSSDCVNC